MSNDHEVRIFEIPGQLANHSVKAIGDYGAKGNFIKEEYAARLGLLPINRSVGRKVTVGGGKEVTTVGTATAPFRFKGEYGVHDLKFYLLPNCIHDVILGKSFLKFTETFSILSNFYRRVKERVVRGISQFHLLYLGASSPMFEGSINGQPQTGLADSGAKVLVMDEAYAQSIDVPVHIGHEHRTRLKFADNSIADTSGMAYDVEWRFGRDGEFTSPYRLNFHILENAPANVVLCDTFLFDNEAFSRYHPYLIDNDDDYEDEDDEFHCFAIDIDQMQSKKFTISQSPDSLSNCRFPQTAIACSLANLQHLEIIRRDEEEDRISDLPADKQMAAQIIENRRRAEWSAEWDRVFAAFQSNSQPQSLQPPFATSVSQLQSTKSAHSSPTNRQGSRSSRTLESRFLKWPTWLRRGQLAGRSRQKLLGPSLATSTWTCDDP